MPELPEVETVKEVLKEQILGNRIADVKIHYESMIKTSDAKRFRQLLIGQKVVDIGRRGKYLIFELEDYHLLSHLRMEGKFFYGEEVDIKDKHVHAEFLLSDGQRLRYEDVRKFGTFHLYEKSMDLELTPSFKVLGVEPFDKTFTIDYVQGLLANKKMPIKSMLLTQKVVTGLGNIYVDEVLFASKIHPLKKSGDLTRDDLENVVNYTREILRHAIAYKGTTIRTFASAHGSDGQFQNFLQVHTKKDEPCPCCRTVIQKIKVGGRGTYFCESCQPDPS